MSASFTAQRISTAVTKLLATRWGDRWPFYYVCEYPKSGGTWLAKMVADYLQIPFPRGSIFPIGCEAVIQNHWAYDARLRRVFYIYRDGRDVMTSFLFYRMRMARQYPNSTGRRARRRLISLFGEGYEELEPSSLLARFIDYEFRRPGLGSRLSWDHHVMEWHAPEDRPHIAYLRYEDLLGDTPGTLARALEQITGQPPEPDQVSCTVRKFSMEAQTGRRPGNEDKDHHIRKGIVGDWKNYFTRECAEIFDHHGGKALIALGYEEDSDWIERAFPSGAGVS